jgi:sirohydrochlorin cobaltochelatase
MSGIGARTGVLLCGHGSRDQETRTEFDTFVAAIRNALTRKLSSVVEGAYLEFSQPTIGEGFARLAASGVKRIVAQPLMLFAARHAKNDVPGEARAFAAAHPEIRIDCGHELSLDAKLLAAAEDRVNEAEASAASVIRRSDTILLTIGRGSSDSEANHTLVELALKLREVLGMAKADIAFAGIAEPNVADGLDQAAQRGFSRVIVLPYFLFTGVLMKRIHALTADTAREYPDIQFLVARHLADHPLVVETVVDRILDLERGA